MREDAVNAHGAQQDRQARKQRHQSHHAPGRSERKIQDVLHRGQLPDRELRALPGDRRARAEQYRGWLERLGTQDERHLVVDDWNLLEEPGTRRMGLPGTSRVRSSGRYAVIC
jgi:hypothetical protein